MVPLLAAVILPLLSTVKFPYVYEPGVTAVVAKFAVIVPDEVIGLPVTTKSVLESPTLDTEPEPIINVGPPV